MTSNERFFQRKQAAAVLKHGILRRYPQVFATMTGSGGAKVVYFDGYAGPGRYSDGSPGSPLLAVETAKNIATWGRQVECLFTEIDPTHAQNLRQVLANEAPPTMAYEVWQGDVEEHVDAALSYAGTDPMLTFLDPFGTALNYSTLTGKLLGRPATAATEVLLNLNLEAVWRIGGLLTGDEREQGRHATLAKLDDFFGDDWWRDVFMTARASGDRGRAARAARAVADEFRRRVRAATGYESVEVPIRRRPSHEPLFVLILFTRYPLAPWKFNEQVSLANADWREACWQEDLDELVDQLSQENDLFGGSFAGDVAREAEFASWQKLQGEIEGTWVDEIGRNLIRLAAANPGVQIGRQASAVYGATLGQARDKHVRAAWDAKASVGLLPTRNKSLKRLEQATLI